MACDGPGRSTRYIAVLIGDVLRVQMYPTQKRPQPSPNKVARRSRNSFISLAGFTHFLLQVPTPGHGRSRLYKNS